VVVAHYKKDDLLNCWTSSSDISGYHADFHEGHGTVGAGQGCGMAGERHGRGMLCVNRPLYCHLTDQLLCLQNTLHEALRTKSVNRSCYSTHVLCSHCRHYIEMVFVVKLKLNVTESLFNVQLQDDACHRSFTAYEAYFRWELLCFSLNFAFRDLRTSYINPCAFCTKKKNPSGVTGDFFRGTPEILSTPSFGREVKPSVPCRIFAACKKSLNGA